jgi:hypothetical protein
MQTCLVWSEDEDRSGAETGLAAIATEDQTYITGDKIRFMEALPFVNLICAGTEFAAYPLIEARLNAPNINGSGVSNLRINRGVAGVFDPTTVGNYSAFPLNWGHLGGNMITAYSYEDDEAGVAHFNHIILVVSNGAIPITPKPITHMPKCTLAATGAAVTWKSNTPTLADELPAGRYRLWGADFVSATALACRFKLPGYDYRPAVLGRRNEQDGVHPFNTSFSNSGYLIDYQGGTLNFQAEYVCYANETPNALRLYLEKLA